MEQFNKKDMYVVLNQDGMTFDRLTPYANESDEPKEQPTSPSIEKIIEKHFIKNRVYLTSNETHTMKDIIEEILIYKANNHLDELEKWVKLHTPIISIYVTDLLNKIQELKTK